MLDQVPSQAHSIIPMLLGILALSSIAFAVIIWIKRSKREPVLHPRIPEYRKIINDIILKFKKDNLDYYLYHFSLKLELQDQTAHTRSFVFPGTMRDYGIKVNELNEAKKFILDQCKSYFKFQGEVIESIELSDSISLLKNALVILAKLEALNKLTNQLQEKTDESSLYKKQVRLLQVEKKSAKSELDKLGAKYGYKVSNAGLNVGY